MKKFIYILFLILCITSCKNNKKIEYLKLYNGVSDLTYISDDQIAFIVNLSDYNNILSLCYINTDHKLTKVIPIDKYDNIDVLTNYIKLINIDNKLNLIYQNRNQDIIIESYKDQNIIKKIKLKNNKNSYGSLFEIENYESSVFIKSNLKYSNNKHSSYIYNYFILDGPLSVVKKGSADLGELYPEGLIINNLRIYYYLDSRQLHVYGINDKQIKSLYQFDKDIIELKIVNNRVVILLSDTLFVTDDVGNVTKGFKLLDEESDYIATGIATTTDNSIMVCFSNNKDTIFKSFSIHGNQLNQYAIEGEIVGDSLRFLSEKFNGLIYSTKDSLYLKEL